MASALENLQRRIADREVVLVVGTGVPLSATGRTDLLTWAGLLDAGLARAVERCRRGSCEACTRAKQLVERARGGRPPVPDLLEVADHIWDHLEAPGSPAWRDWLERCFGRLEVRDDRLVRDLAGLGLPILTTNYDHVIEEVTGLPAVTFDEPDEVLEVLRGKKPGVVHLHGSYKKPETIVFGRESYEALRYKELQQTVQQGVGIFNSLLLIGCGEGVNDPNFGHLRERFNSMLRETRHRHFRLDTEAGAKRWQEETGPEEKIDVIAYGRTYDALPAFVEKQLLPFARPRAVEGPGVAHIGAAGRAPAPDGPSPAPEQPTAAPA